MSFVLRMEVDHDECLYFRGWIKGNRSRPEFGSILRDGKHWARRAKANEFYKRNKEILDKYHVEIYRVVREEKFCKECGAEIDQQDSRSTKDYCDDSCRNKFFKSLNS